MKQRSRERGTVLVAATIAFTLVLAYALATLTTTTDKVRVAEAGGADLSARYVAQAGLENGIQRIRTARDMALFSDPFAGIDGLDADSEEGVGHFSTQFTAEPLISTTGETVGEFDVAIDVTERSEIQSRDVAIISVGYVPSKAAFANGAVGSSRVEVQGTVRVALSASEVFDYSYFINHWGWFYGDNIECNGNARANGQFDFADHTPFINGSPRYEGADGADLLGYIDDNGDGIEDGSDGGVYSGWQVLGAGGVQGMGGLAENQHSWVDQVPMPNLSDLTVYENIAADRGGTISVAGSGTLVDGVIGDDDWEPQNVYLEGTEDNPIVLDGPVVIRGDVIIKGVVTGQGTIYAGRNVYVADDLVYKDPPTTARPSSNDEATVEAWRSANASKDALGLFAREHIVLGDYTHSWFQSLVGSWISDPNNKSLEDAGADGIHNTAAGVDGITPSADDDVGDGDGEWTVDYYTAADQALGLIPAGHSIGDVVPGSGEDIDGDGVYDPQTTLADFEISAPLDPSNWRGLSEAHAEYGEVSDVYVSKVEGSFYTNHFFAALLLAYDSSAGGYEPLEFNGSIVSRNESIIYGATTFRMNHDERLSGGNGASAFGLYLPLTWAPIEVLQWSIGDAMSVDPYVD